MSQYLGFAQITEDDAYPVVKSRSALGDGLGWLVYHDVHLIEVCCTLNKQERADAIDMATAYARKTRPQEKPRGVAVVPVVGDVQ